MLPERSGSVGGKRIIRSLRIAIAIAMLAPLAMVAPVRAATMQVANARSGATPAEARYLCLIVLDAGRPDYITDDLSHLPTFRALMRHGRWYTRAWVGDLMSMTPPSHAVIGTGSLPRDDGGIVNWNWKDRATGQVTPSLQSLANYENGYAFSLLTASGTPTLAGLIRKRYPHDLVIAGAGAHFHAAGMLGGPQANWIFSYARKNGYWAPYTLGPHPVPSRLLNDPSLRGRLPVSNDTTIPLVYQPLPLGAQAGLVFRFADRALQLYRPRAMMFNVAGPDTIGHFSHQWRHDEAILYPRLDRELAGLLNAYRAAGIYDKTLFVITSDHGMIQSTDRYLDTNRVADILSSAGAEPLMTNGVATDTMMSIWLKDSEDAGRAARALYRGPLDNVSAVFYLTRLGNRYQYQMAGCHDCSSRLVAAYRYLLSTEAGPTAEDIAILLRENARFSDDPRFVLGSHGGADWDSQHVTLLLSGPGVKTGVSAAPARLADIAPTIERFMGITPDARDGRVLADAFMHPSKADVAGQRTLDLTLSPLVSALQERAQADDYLEARGLLPNSPPEDRARYERINVVDTFLLSALAAWAVVVLRARRRLVRKRRTDRLGAYLENASIHYTAAGE